MEAMIPLKKCTKCGEIKPETTEFFPKEHRVKDGLSSWCKQCHNACANEWKEKNKERIKEYALKRYAPKREATLKKRNNKIKNNHKQCTRCGIIKEKTQFPRHKASFDGLNPRCRSCANTARKKYSFDAGKKKATEHRQSVSHEYIAHSILKMNKEIIPKEFLELKRIHITLKRIRNERKNKQSVNP